MKSVTEVDEEEENQNNTNNIPEQTILIKN